MNRKQIMIACLLLAGCGSGEDEAFFPYGEQVPVTIETSLDADIIQTRANVSSGSIGVFLGNVNGYKPQYNVQYSYSGGWKASAPVYVGVPNATLHAYYPYNVVTFTANSTTCTLTAQKYDAAKDLCYAKTGGAAVCNKTPNATFAMTRAYARLKLSIKRHATNYVSGNCNITNVNIKHSTGNNFFVSRTLDISTGTNGGSATANGWTYALNTGNIAANATNTAYDVLVPPQPVSGGLTITLTIDGVNRAVTVPAAQFSNNLTAGKQYTISLIITDAEIMLPASAVTTNDWSRYQRAVLKKEY